MKRWSVLMMIAVLVAALPTGCGQRDANQMEGNSTASAPVQVLDASNFDAGIREGVVLVDFWAKWCGPCKLQTPIVERVAGRVEGKAKVAKLDIDAAPQIAQRFGVRAIPTLIVFKNGKSERQFVGLTEVEPLVSAITAALESK